MLLLFTALALAPFLVASLVQYRQATEDGAQAADAVATVIASAALQVGERTHREASDDALSFARHLRAGGSQDDWAAQFPRSIRSIDVRDGAERSLGSWRNPGPTLSPICTGPGEVAPFTVAVSVPLDDGTGAAWRAEVSADPGAIAMLHSKGSVLGTEGSIEIRDGERGYLSSHGCRRALAGTESAAAADEAGVASGLVRSTAPLTVAPWMVVVSVDPASIGVRTGTAAWFFAVAALTALMATLLFTLFLSGVTRSLEHLARAADRIGEGDFNPWLPPPGDDEAGRLSFAIGRMADRVREMMEKVKRTGQMAAIGEMASYVAHEIRNPLSSLRLNLQSVERSASRGILDPDDHESLSVCLREVSRLDRVVSGVLQLSKPESGEVNLTSLHGVIHQAAELLADEIKSREVKLILRLAAGDDWIRADAQQMEAALINLLLNASEAVGEEGTIEVSTRSVLRGDQPAVELLVADNGPGVPLELRPRIFEPFFTTKPTGSGLGLAVVMRTVEQHGGTMRLDQPSGLGEGAVFRMVFPTLPHDEQVEPRPRRWVLIGLDKPRQPWARFSSGELKESVNQEEGVR